MKRLMVVDVLTTNAADNPVTGDAHTKPMRISGKYPQYGNARMRGVMRDWQMRRRTLAVEALREGLFGHREEPLSTGADGVPQRA